MRIDLGTMRLGARLRGPLVLSLEAGEFLRLEGNEGVVVRCEAGRVWITREGDCADVWLGHGESAVLGGEGLTLVEAMGTATLRIGRS